MTMAESYDSGRAGCGADGAQGKQRVLFSGLDCLPGQLDLFEVDGCGQGGEGGEGAAEAAEVSEVAAVDAVLRPDAVVLAVLHTLRWPNALEIERADAAGSLAVTWEAQHDGVRLTVWVTGQRATWDAESIARDAARELYGNGGLADRWPIEVKSDRRRIGAAAEGGAA
jgi:hypothetical protein